MFATVRSSRILLAVLAISLLTLATPFNSAMAKKPLLKQAPAQSVCDGLIGLTPGLYGLCVAYCDAQSCDAEGAKSGQCKRTKPNESVLRNYNRKMQAGGPPMPCVAPPTSPCPCLTEEEAGFSHWVSCSVEDGQTRVSGMQGELLSIDTGAATCELSNMYGVNDRFSGLNGQQLQACNTMVEMATDYDGIRCEDASEEEDEGLE